MSRFVAVSEVGTFSFIHCEIWRRNFVSWRGDDKNCLGGRPRGCVYYKSQSFIQEGTGELWLCRRKRERKRRGGASRLALKFSSLFCDEHTLFPGRRRRRYARKAYRAPVCSIYRADFTVQCQTPHVLLLTLPWTIFSFVIYVFIFEKIFFYFKENLMWKFCRPK